MPVELVLVLLRLDLYRILRNFLLMLHLNSWPISATAMRRCGLQYSVDRSVKSESILLTSSSICHIRWNLYRSRRANIWSDSRKLLALLLLLRVLLILQRWLKQGTKVELSLKKLFFGAFLMLSKLGVSLLTTTFFRVFIGLQKLGWLIMATQIDQFLFLFWTSLNGQRSSIPRRYVMPSQGDWFLYVNCECFILLTHDTCHESLTTTLW